MQKAIEDIIQRIKAARARSNAKCCSTTSTRRWPGWKRRRPRPTGSSKRIERSHQASARVDARGRQLRAKGATMSQGHSEILHLSHEEFNKIIDYLACSASP